MDLDDIKSDLANIVADFYLDKDCLKHKKTIERNIKIINDYIDANGDNTDNPISYDLMNMGYWLYRISINKFSH